jgi:thiamine biosynthesis lipoprotein
MTTSTEPVLRRRERVMGTVAAVELYEPIPHDGLVDDVFAWLHEVDRRFSTFMHDSEVSRLHRGELPLRDCSQDLRYVLDQCADLWDLTDGYFDVYAAGRLDPSGYVKGWSVQIASERLSGAGAINHYVEAGGDIQTRGRPGPADQWRIGIRHPWQRDKVCWVVHGTDMAIATSGLYERGLHVINPRTGEPADELQSVTVIGRDLGPADAYATAAVAMGRSGLDWLARLDGYECAVILADGTAFESAHLSDMLSPAVSTAGAVGPRQSFGTT